MSTINEQPLANPLALSDLLAVWSAGNSDTRRASITALLALIQANIVFPVTPVAPGDVIFMPFVGGINTILAQPAVGVVLPAAPTFGQTVTFIATGTNTGPVTLQINGTYPQPVQNVWYGPNPLRGGEIVTGAAVVAVFDGTRYQLIDGTKDLFYVGNPGLFGEPLPDKMQISAALGVVTSRKAITQIIGSSKGNNGGTNGQATLRLLAMDSPDVAAGTRGLLYPLIIEISPLITRVGSAADANGVSIQNITGIANACGADALWIGHNATSFALGNPEWQSIINSDARFITGIRFNGEITSAADFFIDFFDAVLAGQAIRLPNNKSIQARDAGNASNRTLIVLSATDNVEIGAGTAQTLMKSSAVIATGNVQTNTWFGTSFGPTRVNAAAYVVGTDANIVVDYAAGTCTLTLPTPASFNGRELFVKTTQAFTVVSATANVEPLVGGASGTAILAAVAGKWARLLCDGAKWVIMAGN